MAIGYCVQSFLSFMIFSGMQCFSKYLPIEIPNLNCCIRLYGGLVRFFMSIQIKLHYVTFFQIMMLWVALLGKECEYNTNLAVLELPGGAAGLSETQGIEEEATMEVCGLLWVLMHVIGGIIRSMVHIEPYYDIPEDPDEPEWKVILFQRCGP